MSDIRTIRLSRDAAVALVKEARERFDNGAHELYCSDDQDQAPTIAACTEMTSPWRWPHEETPVGPQEKWFAEFEFSADLAWIKWNRDQQSGYIADFDSGTVGVANLGYHAEQVFLLHVLDGLVDQQKAGVV